MGKREANNITDGVWSWKPKTVKKKKKMEKKKKTNPELCDSKFLGKNTKNYYGFENLLVQFPYDRFERREIRSVRRIFGPASLHQYAHLLVTA